VQEKMPEGSKEAFKVKVDIRGLTSDELHLDICYQGHCPE